MLSNNKRKSKLQRRCLFIGMCLMIAAACLQAVNCAMIREAQPWSRQDKIAAGFMVAGRTADMISTRYALDHGCRETSPLLSDHPDNRELITFAVGTTLLVLLLAHILPPDVRRGILYGIGGVSGGAAVKNYFEAR